MARIGIVSDLIERNRYSGMAVYISEISKELVAKSGHTIIPIFLQAGSPPLEWLFVQFKSRIEIFKNRLDFIYFPNPPTPLIVPIPSLLTIPDLSFMFDRSFSPVVKLYLWLSYFISAHASMAITTFSENSVRDIKKYLLVSHKKITIVAPFVNDSFNNLGPSSEQIILSVPGTFVPRKNISDLLAAYSLLPKNLKKKYPLVIIGKKDEKYFPSLQPDQAIHFVGNVSSEEILDYYQKAAVLVCTSLYEGFGLPCLEAMTAGVPVIAYNNSSLTEIVGQAGILVDDKEELALALERILSNKDLRFEYRVKGRIQAKNFSKIHSTQKLLELIDYASLHR